MKLIAAVRRHIGAIISTVVFDLERVMWCWVQPAGDSYVTCECGWYWFAFCHFCSLVDIWIVACICDWKL